MLKMDKSLKLLAASQFKSALESINGKKINETLKLSFARSESFLKLFFEALNSSSKSKSFNQIYI